MSATLGGYIKDLRLQKNISQLEIAFALGWKEPSRLSRIEQGKVGNPSRELIDKLMTAMHLSEEEKNQLLVIGNYLPTKEEVEEARKKIIPIIDSWKFPATCYDYTWRIIYTNQKLYKLLDISPRQQKEMEYQLPSIIEAVFDPDFILNRIKYPKELQERKKYLLRVLLHYLYEQRVRTGERWYQELIKRMMNNSLFRELWPQALQQLVSDVDLTNFGEKSLFSNEERGKGVLNFKFFVMPVFKDPRFMVELYMPSDVETFRYFHTRK